MSSAVNGTNRCMLAFLLNAAIDAGRDAGVTVEAVQQRIHDGTIFELIEELTDGAKLLTVLDAEKRYVFIKQWRHFALDYNERKSFGVESNGVCLLIAYVLEGIQLVDGAAPNTGLDTGRT